MTDIAEVSPQETTEPAAKGLDAIIDGAIDKLSGQEAPADEAPKSEPADGRARDERGRFKAKEDGADTEAPAEGSATEAAPPADQTTAEPVAIQPLEPHARWSDADKAVFAKLPREGQEFLLAREKAMEGDYTRKTQEVAEQRKTIEPLLNSVQRLSQFFASEGISPESTLEQSAQIHWTLKHGTPEQKRQVVTNIARFAGIELPAANGGENPQDVGQEWVDPQVQQLSQKLMQVEQLANGLASQLQNVTQQTTQAERARAEAEFSAIGQAKDQSGQPKYPHFERVRAHMIDLVANGREDTWDDAYDTAVLLDKELRKGILTSNAQAAAKAAADAEEKRRQEAVQKAGKAAPVAVSHGVKGATKAKGLDAVLAASLDKYGV